MIVETVLAVLAVYLAFGILFALLFHFAGLKKVDPVVQGAGFFFRLLITPGLAGLWPLMAAKWAGAASGRETYGAAEAPVSPSGLRTFHRRLAAVLVVLLPLAVIAAVGLRPEPPLAQPAVLPLPPALPEATAEQWNEVVDTGILARALRRGQARQLQLIVPEDLPAPGAILFWWEGADGSEELGPIGAPGLHRFALPSGTGGRVLAGRLHTDPESEPGMLLFGLRLDAPPGEGFFTPDELRVD